MSSMKKSVWQNLAIIGKSILAHVTIHYDGAKGSLHIDIVPADSAEIIADCEQKSIEQLTEFKALTDNASHDPDEKKAGSHDD